MKRRVSHKRPRHEPETDRRRRPPPQKRPQHGRPPRPIVVPVGATGLCLAPHAAGDYGQSPRSGRSPRAGSSSLFVSSSLHLHHFTVSSLLPLQICARPVPDCCRDVPSERPTVQGDLDSARALRDMLVALGGRPTRQVKIIPPGQSARVAGRIGMGRRPQAMPRSEALVWSSLRSGHLSNAGRRERRRRRLRRL